MTRIDWIGLLAAAACAGCGPAPVGAELLCARPEVLQDVGRIVRQWDIYNTIDPYSVRETPTDRANAVTCSATMRTLAYEPRRDGWRPVPVTEQRRYDVQVDGNRFLVQVPR